MIRWLLADQPEDIDERLATVFGRRRLAATQVDAKVFAYYLFVDLFKAADEYFAGRRDVATLESQHDDEGLNSILHGKPSRWVSRRIKRSQNLAWPVGPGEEIYLPSDRFWLSGSASTESRDRLVVRLDRKSVV